MVAVVLAAIIVMAATPQEGFGTTAAKLTIPALLVEAQAIINAMPAMGTAARMMGNNSYINRAGLWGFAASILPPARWPQRPDFVHAMCEYHRNVSWGFSVAYSWITSDR